MQSVSTTTVSTTSPQSSHHGTSTLIASGVAAVVFDFDGLICDTEDALVRAVNSVFVEHGCTLPLDRWSAVIGTSTPDDFWIPWLIEKSHKTVDPETALATASERNRAYVRELDLKHGVAHLLDAAGDANVPVAIASSSPSSWVLPLVTRLGIRQRFATVVTRHDAPLAKPAPDLYLEALHRLGIDDPTTAVALEDSRNGSLAAKAAGMFCVAVPGTHTAHQDFGHVDVVTNSLANLSLNIGGSLTLSH